MSIHTILLQQVEIKDTGYFKIILSMAVGTPETAEHHETSFLLETALQIYFLPVDIHSFFHYLSSFQRITRDSFQTHLWKAPTF